MATAQGRDLRLDFFRGIAMMIILIAHTPGNWWTLYIPARFGFSDATEMFVFLSGFAASIAFGGTFRRVGFVMGSLRVGYRVWQIYVAHLGLFFAIAFICVLANQLLDYKDYVGQLNLYFFFEETPKAMLGLFTLTYVPNYFDILPMYMVALVLTPLVVLLARIHVLLMVLFCFSLYTAAWVYDLNFPAELWRGESERGWFFNPLTWQLIFFTGFAIGAGWIKPPPPHRWLILLCLAVVVIAIPICFWRLYRAYDLLAEVRSFLQPAFNKTDFGLLRWLHFLALAFLAAQLMRGREVLINSLMGRWICKIGQQSLAIFLFSMAYARVLGMALDAIEASLIQQAIQGLAVEAQALGDSLVFAVQRLEAQYAIDRSAYISYYALAMALVNLIGLTTLVLVAYMVAWFKSTPWKRAARAQLPANDPSSLSPASAAAVAIAEKGLKPA